MIEEIVDFLVIGSGPSGSAATWSLADTGMRIMYTSNGVKSFFCFDPCSHLGQAS